MLNKFTLSALLLALLPLEALARDYHVEAIIFTNPIPADYVSRPWDENAPRNIRAQNRINSLFQQAEAAREERETGAVGSSPTEADNQPIETRVSFKLGQLHDIWKKLDKSAEYEVLQTLSWDQPEASYQESPLIGLKSARMKGTIRVYAPNLLFTELNLMYAPDGIPDQPGMPENLPAISLPQASPATSYAGAEQATGMMLERFFLEEKRKLKLNEIHYFDHTRFGAILSVMPIEAPLQTDADQAPTG